MTCSGRKELTEEGNVKASPQRESCSSTCGNGTPSIPAHLVMQGNGCVHCIAVLHAHMNKVKAGQP